MNIFRTLVLLLLILVLAAMNWQAAKAQTIDIDIDPIAYVLNGYSLHAGLNTGHVRYDIGLFGIEVPEFFHGNEGFTNKLHGAGAKADYYFSGTDKGLFTGIGIDLTRSRIHLEESGDGTAVTQFGAGVNFGYKISVTRNLFIKPWFGLSYLFNADDILVNGQRFEQSAIRPFPTVHIGWVFH